MDVRLEASAIVHLIDAMKKEEWKKRVTSTRRMMKYVSKKQKRKW
ncbi:hypothetical protein [Brevibacillus sp. SIMBA_076]